MIPATASDLSSPLAETSTMAPTERSSLPSDPSRIQELGSVTAASNLADPSTLAVAAGIEKQRTHRQLITRHWECTVEEIREGEFVATLRSLHDTSETDKEAVVPVDEVSPDDLELLEPGAVFYWTVGYDTSPGGTRRRFSQLKFRRLPAWTRKDLRRVEAAADDLFTMFGNPDAGTTSRGR